MWQVWTMGSFDIRQCIVGLKRGVPSYDCTVDLENVANVQNVSAAGEKYVTFDGIAKACAKV